MKNPSESLPNGSMPLGRCNFIAMACAGLMIIVGFILMLGSGNNSDTFNPDIFSTRRIVVGPAICFLGFVAMAFAIIIRPGQTNSSEKE